MAGLHTKTEVDCMIARMLTPFRQDVVGDNPIAISAGVETRLVINGAARNVSQAPPYMTDRYNTSTDVMTAISEYDGPTYAGDVGFVWTPDASSEGHAAIRVYINDASPKLIRTYEVGYKGASALPLNIGTSWYWGEEDGYDAKNDGVYWTVEFEHDGDLTSPSIVVYNTQ